MSLRQNSGTFSNPACFLPLVTFLLSCAFSPWAAAQSCGSQGVAVQVLGSGGPELQDKRAMSMYQLIRQANPISDREFEIEFLDPGVEAFSFTFG
jgi:hypothetical protein